MQLPWRSPCVAVLDPVIERPTFYLFYACLHQVDIVAGKMDGVIAPQNVVRHYHHMKAAGCHVSFREFNFGHLDFTFAYKEDLRHFVLSRLLMRH